MSPMKTVTSDPKSALDKHVFVVKKPFMIARKEHQILTPVFTNCKPKAAVIHNSQKFHNQQILCSLGFDIFSSATKFSRSSQVQTRLTFDLEEFCVQLSRTTNISLLSQADQLRELTSGE